MRKQLTTAIVRLLRFAKGNYVVSCSMAINQDQAQSGRSRRENWRLLYFAPNQSALGEDQLSLGLLIDRDLFGIKNQILEQLITWKMLSMHK